MKYQSYDINNFRNIPQVAEALSEQQKRDIEIVGSVLPFKTNKYVVEQLIDWSKVPDDPMFILTFPQRGMLSPEHFETVEKLIDAGAAKTEITAVANEIRASLNPHPAGQLDLNTPVWCGRELHGFQHKYRETLVFFPGQGQTCHAYCTFCFRWPQFVGIKDLKISSKEPQTLVDYVAANPQITDVLFTGGDPLVMKSRILAAYIKPLLDAEIPHLRNIRIGSKALSYWPQRFLTDDDSSELLNLFREVKIAGKHLAFMAHFNHPAELKGEAVRAAIDRINDTGAIIRTQSPLLQHINDSPEALAEMWRAQVALGCVPYYLFIARNTGAQQYFSVPLVKAWQIYREAYQQVSGICRTIRGPVMSCLPGKIQVLGAAEVQGRKVMAFRMIQGRNPDWIGRPFFSEYDDSAVWYRDLKPAFGDSRFFFQDELDGMMTAAAECEADNLE
ncbi:lysine 2,3-aminomutase [Dehalogenimonas sp. 4OHTPN]|uniref:Lysine 2,3-aminomutase n=1 Tax=Dehalogenimonas sp. 4OHTPN TaxID=3166643 RepID=A0AAU8G8M4_9CHLR